MENALLTYDSVAVAFGGKEVVRDISFSLRPGEILGLVGESGSGKSTILRAAMGLLGANGLVARGDIRLEDESLTALPQKRWNQIRGAKIGMIFQNTEASLCPVRTIGSQIYESLAVHQKISKAEARERALALFEKLRFRDAGRVWDSYPFELSGGMNQRVGIAIAMLLNPAVLLADEPTSALDISSQRQVVEELLSLRELFGTAILIVTHDIGVVSAMADNVLVLQLGNIMEYGSARQVLTNPRNGYTQTLLSAVPKLKRD